MKTVFIVILLTGLTAGQTKTNLDIFYSLIDSALSEVISHIIETAPGNSEIKEGTFYFEAGEVNHVFYNRVASEMLNRNFRNAAMQESDLVLIIESTSVKYGEMFRNSFLGDFYMQRDLGLKGNYLLKRDNKYRNFNFLFSDTIAVDSVQFIENEIYPFTKGELPSEPFFSSLLEPALAIGTTALAVILFFSIRSN